MLWLKCLNVKGLEMPIRFYVWQQPQNIFHIAFFLSGTRMRLRSERRTSSYRPKSTGNGSISIKHILDRENSISGPSMRVLLLQTSPQKVAHFRYLLLMTRFRDEKGALFFKKSQKVEESVFIPARCRFRGRNGWHPGEKMCLYLWRHFSD